MNDGKDLTLKQKLLLVGFVLIMINAGFLFFTDLWGGGPTRHGTVDVTYAWLDPKTDTTVEKKILVNCKVETDYCEDLLNFQRNKTVGAIDDGHNILVKFRGRYKEERLDTAFTLLPNEPTDLVVRKGQEYAGVGN